MLTVGSGALGVGVLVDASFSEEVGVMEEEREMREVGVATDTRDVVGWGAVGEPEGVAAPAAGESVKKRENDATPEVGMGQGEAVREVERDVVREGG